MLPTDIRIDTPKERDYHEHDGIPHYEPRQLAGEARPML